MLFLNMYSYVIYYNMYFDIFSMTWYVQIRISVLLDEGFTNLALGRTDPLSS